MTSASEDHTVRDTKVAVDSPLIPETGSSLPVRNMSTGTSPASSEFRQYRAPIAKATARQPVPPPTSVPSSVITSGPPSTRLDATSFDDSSLASIKSEDESGLFSQVYDWLQHEKARRLTRKARHAAPTSDPTNGAESQEEERPAEHTRPSGSTFSLDKLEHILLQFAGPGGGHGLASHYSSKRIPRRRPKGLRRGSASESDYTDVEQQVPNVEATLDNSKTLAYASSTSAEHDTSDANSIKRAKDKEAWAIFKTEIVRLVHTLQLRGWRKMPRERAEDIEVVRLSGAMTNAIYVVAPPKNLLYSKGSDPLSSRRPPPKLLLRIYGPQVDHLIDREKELQILRRLGRKNIGPRVLGTFLNGRFEEYFEARPLTFKDLRIPETARQIAKRMRELHDGIELLEEEREGGPKIFQNWEKWVDRCEQVTTWLDKELQSPENEAKAANEPWRKRGFVCGVPWATFRKAVENYRTWLISSCGGIEQIKRELVFAHNDTQYGNLLRMEPATESPLLLPANEHKQLVVIDFEYSSANTAGFEFANHFTEWCYNYHDEERPWACNNRFYPTPDDQYRFVMTYLTHRPAVTGGVTSPMSTPAMRGGTGSAITPLTLDDCSEGLSVAQMSYDKSIEEELEMEVRRLMQQTRLWRVMCSAQWAAWGIVQAKVPDMEEGIATMTAGSNDTTHENGHAENGEKKPTPVDSDVDEEDEFDYLAYAQDRALFFWSDLLALKLIDPAELPAPMVEHIQKRIVDY